MVVILVIVILVGASLVFFGCQATRAGYGSSPYTVACRDGNFELREYPALTVVETPMKGGANGGDGSFNRLFGFISGKNATAQKIPMTTPVLMSGGDANRKMAFVMPAALNPARVPKPSDESLAVRELPGGQFAVMRFSGSRNDQRETETLGELKKWMESRGLASDESPVYGYFDPPWTPALLRRNEVMLRVVPVHR